MKIVVCVRRAANGELNPFDACAYEAALSIPRGEVILLSMAPRSCEEFFSGLTRLGAAEAVLLSDPVFAGADTLATAYVLSLALKKLKPDLIFCGRKTLDGSTGQIPPEICEMLSVPLLAGAMKIEVGEKSLVCTLRSGERREEKFPALVSVERINTLRLPSIFSHTSPVRVLSAADLGAVPARCGQSGSPTRVVQTFENLKDRRRCTFLQPAQLPEILRAAKIREKQAEKAPVSGKKLGSIWIIGSSPREMAETVAENIEEIPLAPVDEICNQIRNRRPRAVLWGSDAKSCEIAARVAARLGTGLCADCTALETDGEELHFFRPAFEGNILAKIRCLSFPAMATVRTGGAAEEKLMIGIGNGAVEELDAILSLAKILQADIGASRRVVDRDILPYEYQVGLTGRSVNPKVYLALGISGAVHHIAGINRAQTVIAVNSDPDAPIFNFADYGIISPVSEILSQLKFSH